MQVLLVCMALGLQPCPGVYPHCPIQPQPVFILDDTRKMCLTKEAYYESKI